MIQRLVAYSYAKLVFWLDHEGLKAGIQSCYTSQKIWM